MTYKSSTNELLNITLSPKKSERSKVSIRVEDHVESYADQVIKAVEVRPGKFVGYEGAINHK